MPAPLQPRWLAHAVEWLMHAPVASHAAVVRTAAVQLVGAPQAFPAGYTHAPLVPSQPVGSQAMSAVAMHCAVQQAPLPATPQKPDAHMSFATQPPVICWGTQFGAEQ